MTVVPNAVVGGCGPSVAEEQVAAKGAALERQIIEQARLRLQLKSKRSGGSESDAGGAAALGSSVVGVSGAGPGPSAEEGAVASEKGTHPDCPFDPFILKIGPTMLLKEIQVSSGRSMQQKGNRAAAPLAIGKAREASRLQK